ncbi:MAG TPA: hypothetical protein VHE60_05340 [Pyrinomonadaceae bacterium]|nr:hypothetical protein [Pyrinomonadaceae bacterium]
MQIAIAALVIALVSLITTIVLGTKNYRKSRRLEFFQRRDRLSQIISTLADRNTEFHLISARYAIVATKNEGLPLRGEQAERNTALIASIKVQREGVEEGIKLWDDNIEKLHFIYSNLTLETDAPEVERMITMAQVASDNLKKATVGYSSILHILETSNELMKTNLTETEEKIRQINLDFERGMKNLGF